MCSPVERLIEQFSNLHVDYISIHAEASHHTERLLQSIKDNGVKAGLVLNPATPIEFVEYVLHNCDLILLMTVNPGFGGQSFLHSVLPKINQLRKRIDNLGKDIRLQVDGGVNNDTIKLAKDAGADTFVVGSHLFKSPNYSKTIQALRNQLA
jgi:ribulose-phosphate 3-epimerase